MLRFSITGADGIMLMHETLTSGMVGKQVQFAFSEEWSGLSKVAVFTAGNVTRDAVVEGDLALIPPEVLERPMRQLYVGVYGMSADGSVVIPTVRVQGPCIAPGADPSGDPGAAPELAVWGQILGYIGDLKELNTSTKENLVAAVNELVSEESAGLTKTEKNLMLGLFKNLVYTADMSETIAQLESLWNNTEVHTHSYSASVTSAATCTTAGVRTYTCSCGESYTEEIPATGHTYVDGVCAACGAADPNYDTSVTLTSISAAYSGGEVEEGTAVTELTGIVVTAFYSDGSSKEVTGYTLSGTISEGGNTITVSYGGMSATFTVTGVAAEEPAVTQLLYNWDLTSSLTDTIGGVTATLSGSATQDENGLTISGANGSCYFGSDIFSAGRSFEVDIASADCQATTTHDFLIMTGTTNGVANGVGNEGLTYKNAGIWSIYAGAVWQTTTEPTDKDIVSGKTIRFLSHGSDSFSVYIGDTKLGTASLSVDHTTALQIGSSSKAYYNVVVTAVRVYGEVV